MEYSSRDKCQFILICRINSLSDIALNPKICRMAFVAQTLPGMPTRNLHKLENSVLIDMLAKHTLIFTHLFRIYKGIPSSREYQNCKKTIEKIISELDKRGLIPKSISDTSKEERLSLLSKWSLNFHSVEALITLRDHLYYRSICLRCQPFQFCPLNTSHIVRVCLHP